MSIPGLQQSCQSPRGRNFLNRTLELGHFICCFLALLLLSASARAQTAQPPVRPAATSVLPGPEPSPGADQAAQSSGSISGTIVDPNGHALAGVRIKLDRGGQTLAQETVSDEDGHFYFVNIAAGPFYLSLAAEGFADNTWSGTVHSGEAFMVPQITMILATEVTQVHVAALSPIEIAQEQLHEQEQQRVFGFIPNFYVSYVPDAVALSPKQKFHLAWKSMIDPVTFGITGAVAGIEQAANQYSGYGQGADGYAKRYGAAYADDAIGTFLGGAVLPSLLKQDPRYFYKGTGSKKSRILYAIATSVICKGDNGRWQPNYSGIAGSLAAGGISNLYYPSTDRNGAALAFENAAINIGATAGANLLQEFVIRKFTSNSSSSNSSPNRNSATP